MIPLQNLIQCCSQRHSITQSNLKIMSAVMCAVIIYCDVHFWITENITSFCRKQLIYKSIKFVNHCQEISVFFISLGRSMQSLKIRKNCHILVSEITIKAIDPHWFSFTIDTFKLYILCLYTIPIIVYWCVVVR